MNFEFDIKNLQDELQSFEGETACVAANRSTRSEAALTDFYSNLWTNLCWTAIFEQLTRSYSDTSAHVRISPPEGLDVSFVTSKVCTDLRKKGITTKFSLSSMNFQLDW